MILYNHGVSIDLSQLVQHAPQGIIVIDRADCVVLWNGTAAHILGWSAATMIGQLLPLLDSDDGELTTLIDQIRQQKHRASFRFETRDAADKTLFLHLSIAALDDGQVVLMFDDVTRQVESQSALERRVQDRSRKLQAVYEVVESASDSDDSAQLLRMSLDRVLKVTHASAGAIQRLDSVGERLHLIAHRGLPDEVVAKSRIMAADAGLSGWSVVNDEPLLLDDVNSDWRTSQLIRNSDLTVYAGFPITAGERTIGVLSLFRARQYPFGKEDVGLITAVADQIGIAIDNQQLRQDNKRLLLIEERNRLARELHDAVTQSLYSGTLMTGALQKQLALENWSNAQQIATQLQGSSQQALKEMRLLIHNLRPSALASVGLVEAVRHRLEAVEGRAGIQHRLLLDGEIAVTRYQERMLYFIVQEALNNAIKHADANTVTVRFSQTADTFTMTITDDGRGFDVTAKSSGVGMHSLQERADQIGAQLTVQSGDEGTIITVRKTV